MKPGDKVKIYDIYSVDKYDGKESYFFGLFKISKFKEVILSEYEGTIIDPEKVGYISIKDSVLAEPDDGRIIGPTFYHKIQIEVL